MNASSSRAATEVDEEIGARIRSRRQELDLPMAHVAELVEITVQQFQKYEAGHSRVSASMLMRIAAALQIDPAVLLPGSSRRMRPQRSTEDDGMALQLQHAFGRIKTKRMRRLLLELARRLADDDAPRKTRR